MKKNRSIVLAMVLALSLVLSACGEKKAPVKNVPVADLWTAISETQELPHFMDLDDETLNTVYGLDPADLEEYVAKFPMMNVHATEIFVAKVKDGKMADVKAALEARQQTLAEQWSWYLPEQLELVENYKLVDNGSYVLFVVCEDSQAAVDAFNNALK